MTTNSKLLILGAGGHGRVVADVAASMGFFSNIAFLDDGMPHVKPAFPIIGKIDDAANYLIQGEKGGRKIIHLNRSLVVFEDRQAFE